MSKLGEKIRWGILGTGRIAGIFAEGLKDSRKGVLVAAASRTAENARKFTTTYGGKAYDSYEAAIADPNIDAIYLATPHPQHVRWGIAVLEAGKHLLCEKPLTLNYGEAMALVAAAERSGKLLVEAFMYRVHPQTRRILELVTSGCIGRVKLIEAAFSYSAPFNAESRVWNNALGGGGILDVGCYPISFARLIAGAVQGKPFDDPVDVKGAAQLNPDTGVDEHAAATLRFNNGLIAQVSTGVSLCHRNSACLFGESGWIEIPAPWVYANSGKGVFEIRIHRPGEETVVESIVNEQSVYGLEADAFATAVESGSTSADFMSLSDTLGNMRTLDRWRDAVGLIYESEQPERLPVETVAGTRLSKRADMLIPQVQIPFLQKAASRLVYGCDHQVKMPEAAVGWDAFFTAGGNVFDTAYIYGGGKMERLLGTWLERRGVRDQSVLIVKGAHTPYCNPEDLRAQLEISLDRLKTDHADLYLMHRDDVQIPVGEFVDALNDLKKQGRMAAFGGSNWTLERIVAANEYAARKGLQGFSVVSNQFSLAQMIEPVWAGCESAASEDFRAYLAKEEMALLAWSSQARGFFVESIDPHKDSDAERIRCWHSEDNFKRRERVLELAKERGVSPVAIALSYVLSQPQPILPLIGPRSLRELEDSLQALRVPLNEAECVWLKEGR